MIVCVSYDIYSAALLQKSWKMKPCQIYEGITVYLRKELTNRVNENRS